MRLKQISELPIPHWHRIAKAIYSVTGIAPCVHCMGGGNMKPMILQRTYGEQNKNNITSRHQDNRRT